jgi:hypothetical protein
MDASTPAKTVHYYDTRLHEILCGQRGFEHRSTKHSRNVTCQSCLNVLRKRTTMGTLTTDAPADSAAGL